MDLGIAGRKAVVAAGSAGLGLGSAKALVAEGVQVAICGRDAARLEKARAALGGDTIAIEADLATVAGTQAFAEAALAQLGQVDILVANAGGPPPGTFENTDIEAYRTALELNCLGTIALCQAFVPAMAARGWGRVIAITSIGARQPLGHLMASSTARAAVTSFLKITATEVAARGVTVNSVQPGLHLTDRLAGLGNTDGLAESVPAKTLGDPDDFGKVVGFLASQPARFVTGVGLLVDGGAYPGLM